MFFMLTGFTFPIVVNVMSGQGRCVSDSLGTTHRTRRRLRRIGTRDRGLLGRTRRRRTVVLGRTTTDQSHVVSRTHRETHRRTHGTLRRAHRRVGTRGRDTVGSVQHRITILSIRITRGVLLGGLSSSRRRLGVIRQLVSRIGGSGIVRKW